MPLLLGRRRSRRDRRWVFWVHRLRRSCRWRLPKCRLIKINILVTFPATFYGNRLIIKEVISKIQTAFFAKLFYSDQRRRPLQGPISISIGTYRTTYRTTYCTTYQRPIGTANVNVNDCK